MAARQKHRAMELVLMRNGKSDNTLPWKIRKMREDEYSRALDQPIHATEVIRARAGKREAGKLNLASTLR